MRRKKRAAKKASQRGDDGNATSSLESRETPSLRMIKEVRQPFKGPSGKGLGKAGAKRLGRMLIQALQPGEEPKGKGKVSLPKTPIGLLEYHFQTEANNACETDSPTLPSPHVSRFIGQAVSKYKSKGGMSMTELKQMLAAEGYDDSRNNRQVNVVTKRPVKDETLVPTTRSASFRLNIKADTSGVNRKPVNSPKPKEEMKQNTTAHKFPKSAERSQWSGKNTPTPRGELRKSKRKPGLSHKQPSRTRKCAAKLPEQIRKKPKSKRKAPKPAGKNGRSAKNQATQAQRPQKSTKSTPRRQAKQVQYSYKSRKRQQPRRKRHGTRLRVRQRRTARRTYYD